MIIWVSGVTGFSGGFLVDEIRRRYPRSRILGLGRRAVCGLAVDVYMPVDLVSNPDLDSLCRQYPPQRVFHLAGAMPPAEPAELWHANLAGTHNILAALGRNGLHECRFLCVGSSAELSPNTTGHYTEEDTAVGFSEYGKSKAAQTRLAFALGRDLDIPVFNARPFNLIGPGLPTRLVAGRLCEQLASGASTVKLGNLHPERDFVDVRDAVVAYCDILEKAAAFEIYNVCTGIPVSVERLVRTAATLLGDSMPEVDSDATQAKREDINRVYGDPRKLRDATGWQPRLSLSDSLRDMLEIYRS
jgi:GDP-4-dehydro-6-deoxy-D-mannose reductase